MRYGLTCVTIKTEFKVIKSTLLSSSSGNSHTIPMLFNVWKRAESWLLMTAVNVWRIEEKSEGSDYDLRLAWIFVGGGEDGTSFGDVFFCKINWTLNF